MFTVLIFIVMCIGNIIVGAIISILINDKIYKICRDIAAEKYVKAKNKELSLLEGIKVLSFTLKLNSILNLVCGLLFLVIRYYFLYGWFKTLFIIISACQFFQLKQNFDTFSNKTKMGNMVEIEFLLKN